MHINLVREPDEKADYPEKCNIFTLLPPKLLMFISFILLVK